MHAKVAHTTVRGKRVYRFSKEFVLHSLRHTMLTRLGEAGAEAFTTMKIAGHSSVTVSQRTCIQPLKLWNVHFSDSKY